MRGSSAVAAVEYAYHLIHYQHPELPPLRDVLCLVELPDPRHSAWMHEPAKKGDPYVLVLGTDTLTHARHALYMVLHEAAHILAHRLGVQDIRSDRKYHTTGYKRTAAELGIKAERSTLRPQDGYAFTKPDPAANLDVIYADAITRFDQLKGPRR